MILEFIGRIREALEKDVEDIININIKSWQETYFGIFPKDFLGNLESKKEESIKKCKNKINEYIVCEDKVVGFLRYGKNRKNYSDDYAEVYALYIDSKYKKQGIGSKMLKYIFNKLKNIYDKVLISTLQENSANVFYEKCGGKKIDVCVFKLDNKEYIENLYLFSIEE